MLRTVAVCLLVVIVLSCSVPVERQQHPFLYFYQSDVEDLRAKATTTHAKIFAKIQQLADKLKKNSKAILPPVNHEKFSATWNEEYGNRLAPLSLYCVLRPNDEEVKKFTLQFMDRMAGYPNWLVKSSPFDEVPVSHSLVGFSTAYDFMYSVLDEKRRQQYLEKIVEVSGRHYERAQKAWWGKTYIQNHVATNVVALLTGALVLLPHDNVLAQKWLRFAVPHLNRTLKLLDIVVDGSMDEGTGYGSYTTRSLTQFIFLVKRHLRVDTAGYFWLRQHFWFMLGTVLPGYLDIIGIGDSAQTWFYGPESQLVFLDSFVLKNGHGNWLASRIREEKPMKRKAAHAEYCTLFTEYIWYDPSIEEKSPLEDNMYSPLMRFSDTGLVSFNGGRKKGSTFFSFKSGPLHGRAVYIAVENRTFPWLQGWKKSLNPGHEHPDQNSFVFYPRGIPFITEALYGPKYSFLNNVLTFGPSKETKCNSPHEGQLGECGKWLDWKTPGIEHAWAEVIAASYQESMVFTSGEAVGAYSSKLGLKHVYRSLLLLSEDLLLVVDRIDLHKTSSLKFSNAYFHNLNAPFKILPSGSSAVVLLDGEQFHVQWSWPVDLGNPLVSVNHYNQPRGNQFIRTNYLNISIPLSGTFYQIVYLFSGPKANVKDLKIKESSYVGVRVQVQTSDELFLVSVVTNYTNPKTRLKFIGTLGYAQVHLSGGKVVNFIHKKREKDYAEGDFWDAEDEMPKALPMQHHPSWVIAIMMAIGMLIIVGWIVHKVSNQLWIRILYYVAAATILIFSLLYYNQEALKPSHTTISKDIHSVESLPSVFISSLRGSGGYLLKAMFDNNTDFFYSEFPSSTMAGPQVENAKHEFVDACQWLPNYHKMPKVGQWFRTYFLAPQNTINEEHAALLKRRQLYPYSIVTLQSEYQNWNLKLAWLVNVIGHTLKTIYIVRDPRSWIADQLNPHNSHRLDETFVRGSSQCDMKDFSPPEYDQLLTYLKQKESHGEHELYKLLALLWQSNTDASLRIHKSISSENYLMIHYEDLVDNPLQTAEMIYSYLGLSLPMAVEHRLLQLTKTGLYGRPSTTWRQQLNSSQVRDIEKVCGAAMAKLKYK
jgi:hypothetical protein